MVITFSMAINGLKVHKYQAHNPPLARARAAALSPISRVKVAAEFLNRLQTISARFSRTIKDRVARIKNLKLCIQTRETKPPISRKETKTGSRIRSHRR